jgi:hypothetical protein
VHEERPSIQGTRCGLAAMWRIKCPAAWWLLGLATDVTLVNLVSVSSLRLRWSEWMCAVYGLCKVCLALGRGCGAVAQALAAMWPRFGGQYTPHKCFALGGCIMEH